MKKLVYLIVLALILGLVLTGCLLSNVGQVPTNEQSGISYLTKGVGMTVVSGDSVATVITKVYNKAGGINSVVDLSGSPLNAVRAQEPKPYPTGYVTEGAEVTDSVWDNGVNWFEDNASGADWIWETERAEDPALLDSGNARYDADAARYGRVVLFETTFNIPGVPTSATLHIAADNGYEAWVNSGTHYLSSTVGGSGWETSNLWQSNLTTSGWQSYGTLAISGSDLVNGSNILYVLAGNEYFWTDDGNSPVPPTQSDPYAQYNPGAVIFQLDVAYEEGNPDIEVVKECPPEFAYVGDTLTYNYTVNNTGDGALLDVTLVDDPLGLITLTGLTDEDNDLYLDDLAEGESATGTADYVVLKGDTVLLNTATASSTSEIDDSTVEDTSDECMVEICYEETAFGGNKAGRGNAWWYYFYGPGPGTQTIWAGKNHEAGEVTVSGNVGGKVTITIELADGWYLQDDDESVKIQGYADGSVPTVRQPAGKFETYKGNETIVTVDYFDNYVIQLDVQHCGEFEF